MALTYSRRRLSSSAREALYDRCRGDAPYPICNLCPLPILPGQDWDESHDGAPHALGGTETGIAHRKCNRDHGARVVTPMVAKAKRGRQKFIGAWRSRVPMACGRDSDRMKKMDGRVVARPTRREKLALPAKYRAPEPLDDLTDGLMQGDLPESTFANCASALGAPNEEISDLIVLARVSTEMRA